MADSRGEGRRARRKRELRQRIFDTAARLFLQRGYDATTIDQIAQAVDIAPATFFNHYASKDALLREMTSAVFAVVQTLIEQQRKRDVSTRARLEAMASQAAGLIADTRMLTRDVLLEMMRSTAPPGQAGPLLARVHEVFAALVRDGQQRGDVRRDQDELFLAEMMVGAFNATITNWLNDPTYPLDERMRRAAVFLGEALAPAGGPGRDGGER